MCVWVRNCWALALPKGVSRAALDQAFRQVGEVWALHLLLPLDCCPLRLAGLTHRTALHPFFLSSSVPTHSHEAEVIVICRSSTIDRGLARLQTLQLDKVEIGAQGWQPWHRGLVCKKRQWSLYGLCKGSTGIEWLGLGQGLGLRKGMCGRCLAEQHGREAGWCDDEEHHPSAACHYATQHNKRLPIESAALLLARRLF